jgi:4-hydroxyphenylpyruvate dioxygenase-like putative hemolysin
MGEYSGMRSAVLWSGDFSIVLLEAIGEQSQIHKFIQEFGPGVQHVAFKVENIEEVREYLVAQGVKFSTNIIQGPGLKQMFTHRDSNSGMMFEYIERGGEKDFIEDNINDLFKQLESQNAY